MPKKKYIVKLTTEERFQLKKIINAERMAAHKRRKARILLKIDQGLEGPGWTDDQAAAAFDCCRQTVERLRQRLVDRGFESVLSRQCMKDYFENRQQLADKLIELQLVRCGGATVGQSAGRAYYTTLSEFGKPSPVCLHFVPEASSPPCAVATEPVSAGCDWGGSA